MIGHPGYSNNIIIGLRPAIHISSTRNKWIVMHLLAINELWIDGFNKPILINVSNVPIHTYKQSRLPWTSAVYKQTN
jgi:hypothetical protein